jgi:hypothetical protein
MEHLLNLRIAFQLFARALIRLAGQYKTSSGVSILPGSLASVRTQ